MNAGSTIADAASMRPTHCPNCGADGLAGHEHTLGNGRTFTQYYCGICVKAWAERPEGADDEPPRSRGIEVPHWVGRYVAVFQLRNLGVLARRAAEPPSDASDDDTGPSPSAA